MKSVYAAFVAFQSELKPVIKDSENPFFKSTYADLSSILQDVMPLLTKHKLGLSQTCRVAELGTILQTRVIHESGEEILSEIVLPFNADPQKMGSLISYYKRYMLQATLGVSTADEDDDGNGANGKKPNPKTTTDASRFKGQAKSPGEYEVKFGQFKGQTLSQIGGTEVNNYLGFLLRKAAEEDKTPTGQVKEFIDNAREFLRNT